MGEENLHHLDLRGVICPINFVKTKLTLEQLKEGEQLEVLLDDGEPIMSVPRSVKDEGHKIKKVKQQEDGHYSVVIEKV